MAILAMPMNGRDARGTLVCRAKDPALQSRDGGIAAPVALAAQQFALNAGMRYNPSNDEVGRKAVPNS